MICGSDRSSEYHLNDEKIEYRKPHECGSEPQPRFDKIRAPVFRCAGHRREGLLYRHVWQRSQCARLVFITNLNGSATLPFVISTEERKCSGAEWGEICSSANGCRKFCSSNLSTQPLPCHPNRSGEGLLHRHLWQRSQCARLVFITRLNGSATLPFVISTEAKRSEAQWRDLQFYQRLPQLRVSQFLHNHYLVIPTGAEKAFFIAIYGNEANALAWF